MFRTQEFLFDHWPDPPHLIKFLHVYGHAVKAPMIYQWFNRGRVPADWAFTLLALLEIEKGAPLSLAKYLN